MKNRRIEFQYFFVILTFFIYSGSANAQVLWDRYEHNPVMDVGSAGEWDSRASGPTTVIFQDGMYKAWLYGVDETDTGRIGYATSTDGIAWTKYENNPVLVPGDPGEWDDTNTDHACVLFIDGVYKMWYMGEDNSSARIGYATSMDGINWEKYIDNPVLELGPEGSWDESEVLHPGVIFDGSTYHMWYNGFGEDAQRTGYASSDDGINWVKYSGNPVLSVGESMAWDDYMLALMGVIYKDNEYKMWYTGGDGTDEDVKYFRIGYATSPDGINWSKYEDNPVLDIGEAGMWDSMGVVTSAVLFDSTLNVYKMWYGGLDGSYGRTGYATSDPVVGLNNEFKMSFGNSFELLQNYPNPFTGNTSIKYTVHHSSNLRLVIYDITGRLVLVLVDGTKTAGTYNTVWDGKDSRGTPVPAGIYICKLLVDGYPSANKKLIKR